MLSSVLHENVKVILVTLDKSIIDISISVMYLQSKNKFSKEVTYFVSSSEKSTDVIPVPLKKSLRDINLSISIS